MRYRRRMRIVAMLLLALTSSAHADDAAQMRLDMHTYFAGEKRECLAFGGAGLAAVGLGSGLMSTQSGLARGAAYPLLGVALIELVAGVVLFGRTDAQVTHLDAQLTHAPAAFRTAELTRMRRVNAQFRALAAIEGVLMLAGVGLVAVGGIVKEDTATGVGVGLAVQAATLFMLDTFAHDRAISYEEHLRRFQVAVSADRTTVLASLAKRF